MKHQLLIALLCVVSYSTLYLMDNDDDGIQLDDKSVKKITACINKCKIENNFGIYHASDPQLICTDICTTLYRCGVKTKLKKERKQQLLAELDTRTQR